MRVDQIRDQGLDHVEGQRIHLMSWLNREVNLGARVSVFGPEGQVEEIGKGQRDGEAGEDPEGDWRPEGRRHEQEEIRKVNRPGRRGEAGDGRNSEGVTQREDLGS